MFHCSADVSCISHPLNLAFVFDEEKHAGAKYHSAAQRRGDPSPFCCENDDEPAGASHHPWQISSMTMQKETARKRWW
jgi:hypothetical protein